MNHPVLRRSRPLALAAGILATCAAAYGVQGSVRHAYTASAARQHISTGPILSARSRTSARVAADEASLMASLSSPARAINAFTPPYLKRAFYDRSRLGSRLMDTGSGGGNSAGTGVGLGAQTPKDLDLTFLQNTGPSGNQTGLTKDTVKPPYTDLEPTFAPDRHTVYFSSDRIFPPAMTPSGFHIWQMQSDGSQQTPVNIPTTDPVSMAPLIKGDLEWPSVSVDGRLLAFSAQDTNGIDQIYIYVLQPDPSVGLNMGDIRQITSGAGMKTHPTWSPTNVLAFEDTETTNANPNGLPKIWVVAPILGAFQPSNMSPKAQLTGTGAWDAANATATDQDPAWEPDGAHIAFARSNGSTNRIWIISGVNFSPNGAIVANMPVQFTNFTSPGGVPSDDRYPAWRPEGLDFGGFIGKLAFASTRKSSGNPRFVLNGANAVGATYGIYTASVTYKDSTQYIPNTERGATAVTEDTQHSPASYTDIMPTWSPDSSVDPITGAKSIANRVLYASNSGIPYPLISPQPQSALDIWSSEITDTTPPALVGLPDVTPRQTVPGQPVTISARFADLNSGIAHIYVQIKNPNSYLQDPSLDPLRSGVSGANVTVGDHEFGSLPAVFDGHRIYGVVASTLTFNLNTFINLNFSNSFFNSGSPVYHTYDEEGYQPINPQTYSYSDQGEENIPLDLSPSSDVAGNIVSADAPIPDSLELTQDSTDPNLYKATWITDPAHATDYILDFVAVDNLGNIWDYDNVWGFTTKSFAAGNNPVLLVADYTSPQLFLFARGSKLLGVQYGVESWLTDNPLSKIGGETNDLGEGSITPPPPVLPAKPATATRPLSNVDLLNFVQPNYDPNNPPDPVPGGNFLWGFANTLGIGSYIDLQRQGRLSTFDPPPNPLTTGSPTPTTESGRSGWPLSETLLEPPNSPPTGGGLDGYDIWRVLCRGPVPTDVLGAYGPVPVIEPDPNDVSASVTRLTHPKCVVWASPFTGDEYVGPGTILDPAAQTNITNFIASGGHIFLTGQDIAWALALGVQGSTDPGQKFLQNNFGASFSADFLRPLGDNLKSDGGPVTSRWNPPLSPLNLLAYYFTNDPGVGESEYQEFPSNPLLWGAHDQDSPDVVTTTPNSSAEYTQQTAGGIDMVTLLAPQPAAPAPASPPTPQAIFSSFGIEGVADQLHDISYTYQILDPENLPGPPIQQPITTWASQNNRALLMHDIVGSLRENTIAGQVNILEPDGRLQPLPNALVTASEDVPNGLTFSTALTRGDGSFTLSRLPVAVDGIGGLTVRNGRPTSVGLRSNPNLSLQEGRAGAQISVESPGFTELHPDARPVIIGQAGAPEIVNLLGGTGVNSLVILVSAAPPGTIEGLVTSGGPQGPAVKGATVKLTNTPFSDINLTTTTTDVMTDLKGNQYNYIFTNVPVTPPASALVKGQTPPHYIATVSAPGYITTTVTDLGNDPTMPITVSPGVPTMLPISLTPLPSPMNLSATPGDTTVTLNWTAVTGADSYNVKRSTSSGKEMTIKTGVTGTTFTDTGLTDNQPYFYVVTATTNGGESVPSNEVSAVPLGPPGSPTLLTAVVRNGQVDLTWAAPANAGPNATYNVLRGASTGVHDTTVMSGITTLGFTDTTVTQGMTYYYVVTTTTGSGTSGPSNERSAMLPPLPGKPASLTATAGNGSVLLSWTAVPNAITYNVKRSTMSGGPYTVTLTSTVTDTTFTDTLVTKGVTYYYVVSANGLGGEGPNSPEASAMPPPPPAAPAAPTVAAGNASVTLTWTAVPGAASYNVKRSTLLAGPFTPIAPNVTATTYTDSGLLNGATYYYVISANGPGGESADSPPSLPAQPVAPPASPLTLTGTAGNGLVNLSWTPVLGVNGYNVKRSLVAGGPYTPDTIIASGIGTTAFQDTKVTRGTTYYYVVTALNNGGESLPSNEVAVEPPTIPSPVTNLAAHPDSSSQITLTWSDLTNDATSFKIERSTGGGFFPVVATVAAGGANTYVDTGLHSNTQYTYAVIATNVAGDATGTLPTVVATTLTAPAVPTNLTATEISGNQVSLAWSDTAGDATSFKIERSTAGGAFKEIDTVGGSASSYSDPTVTPNTAYTYRVRVANANGFSDYSNVASVTTGTGVIQGVVQAAAGAATAPLPGVTINLLNGPGGTVLHSTTTDLAGRYSFTSLSNGAYTVQPIALDGSAVTPANVTVNSSINNGVVIQNFTLSPLHVFPAGINLVSLPYDYNGTSIDAAAAFGLTITPTGAAAIAGYDPTTNSYGIYPNLPFSPKDALPGRGYWTKDAASTIFINAGKPVSSPLDITLSPGWNLIGDPYTTSLDLTTLLVKLPFAVGGTPANSLISYQAALGNQVLGQTVWAYSQSQNQYTPATSLSPYAGYWIFVNPQATGNQPVTLRFTNPGA